jgi:hypothetical protein
MDFNFNVDLEELGQLPDVAWDYYKILRRIPAEEAAQPLSESKCSLVKK